MRKVRVLLAALAVAGLLGVSAPSAEAGIFFRRDGARRTPVRTVWRALFHLHRGGSCDAGGRGWVGRGRCASCD